MSFIALNTVLSAVPFIRRFKVLYTVVTRIGYAFSLLSSCLMMSSWIEGDEIIMPSIVLALFRASAFVVHDVHLSQKLLEILFHFRHQAVFPKPTCTSQDSPLHLGASHE